MIEAVSELLAPFDADEWTTPSGRRMDLPNRGNILQVPSDLRTVGDEVEGAVTLPPLSPRPQRRCARRCGGADVGLGARLRGVSAQPQPQAAHGVPARELPQDRADRAKSFASTPGSTEPRGARSSSQADSSTETRCSPTPRRCSSSSTRGSRDRRRDHDGVEVVGDQTPVGALARPVAGPAEGRIRLSHPGRDRRPGGTRGRHRRDPVSRPRMGNRLHRARHTGHRIRLGPATGWHTPKCDTTR